MEFIFIIGITVSIGIILTSVVLEYYKDTRDTKNIDVANGIVMDVEKEIFLATKVVSGYTREFEIPLKINNVDYDISLNGENIILTYGNMDIMGNIPNITGEIVKGKNVIKNNNGNICLNVEACQP